MKIVQTLSTKWIGFTGLLYFPYSYSFLPKRKPIQLQKCLFFYASSCPHPTLSASKHMSEKQQDERKKENENTVNILYQDVKCWLWSCPWNDSANSLALQTLRYSMKIRAAILQDTADMWYWFFLDRTTTSATKNTFWVSFFCDIGRKCFVFQSLSCSLCLLYYTRKKI